MLELVKAGRQVEYVVVCTAAGHVELRQVQ